MLRAAVGHSESPDSTLAIREAIRACQDSLSGATPNAGILFCSADYDHQLILDLIEAKFPGLQLIGCSSDGEISSSGFFDGSVVLMLLVSDGIEIKAGVGERLGRDPEKATRDAVQQARQNMAAEPVLCFSTPESTTISGDEVLRGLRFALGATPAIFGGKAADAGASARTYQFCNGQVFMDAVPVLLLGGSLRWSVGFDHGWSAIGRKRKVTKAYGNRVLECEGESMLSLYRRYLGDHTLVSAEYPLAVLERDRFFLRTPSTYAEGEDAIVFSGEIGVGSDVQFAEATRPSLLEASRKSASDATASYPGEHPVAAISFVCAIRKFLLGTQVVNEAAAMIQELPKGIAYCGLYCFGEFFSPSNTVETGFHNASVVTVLLGSD